MSNLNQKNSTINLYNRTASDWIRGEPSSLSDFTARPFVLELCEPVSGLRVLDIGCGEGYCSRELRRRGAAQVHGIDLSQGMIEAANLQEVEDALGISYEVGCATNLKQFDNSEIDLVVAVFLFNYTLGIDNETLTALPTAPETRALIETYLQMPHKYGYLAALDAVCYASEGIVSSLYAQLYKGIVGTTPLPKESLIFFEVHSILMWMIVMQRS